MALSDFGDYFQSLLASIKKRDLKIDLNHSFEEIEQTILPMYNSGKNINFVGDIVTLTDARFKRLVTNYKTNTYTTILSTIQHIVDNQDTILELVDKEFKDENLKSITDYYKLNLLRYFEAITFFSDYARMWINSATFETVNNPAIISPILKRDIVTVVAEDMMASVAIAINVLNMPFKDYLSSIDNLKGHMYSDDDWGTNKTGASNKLDPHKTNFVPVSWNLVYIIGKTMNGWRVARHQRNKADLTRLQLMLQGLEKQRTANTDPNRDEALVKQINYYSNLSNKISAKIEDFEQGS